MRQRNSDRLSRDFVHDGNFTTLDVRLYTARSLGKIDSAAGRNGLAEINLVCKSDSLTLEWNVVSSQRE